MTLVRTTIRPWEELDVTDAERWNLIRQGLLADYYGTLNAKFYMWEGGPLVDVDDVTITLALEGTGTVIGPTSSGVQHVGTGTYAWTWPDYDNATPGDYTVTWNATDAASLPVAAVETVTLDA